MTKYCGVIGFAEIIETSPGVYVENIVEKGPYYGDILKKSRRLSGGDSINENIMINHEISIIADPYANDHYWDIRYVVLGNTKWKVSDVTVEYPRLIFTLGGLYNVESSGIT